MDADKDQEAINTEAKELVQDLVDRDQFSDEKKHQFEFVAKSYKAKGSKNASKFAKMFTPTSVFGFHDKRLLPAVAKEVEKAMSGEY